MTRLFSLLALVAGLSGYAQGQQLTIITTTLPSGAVGQIYGGGNGALIQTINAAGPVACQSTQLPSGLTISPFGSNCLISGTPTTAGSFSFTVTITDVFTSKSQNFINVTILASGGTGGGALRIITDPTLPFAVQGSTYNVPLRAEGGTLPYVWILGPTAAVGLSIDAATGVLSGTPRNVPPPNGENFTLPITVQDGANSAVTRQFNLFVAAALNISTATLPSGSVGTNYNQTLEAGGGQSPYVWTLTAGTVPPGLTLDRGGRLNGIPSANGVYRFTVQVADVGSRTTTREFTITIGQPIQISTASLPDVSVGVPYTFTLTATGGREPYTWSVTGLPAGITFAAGTGVISGTATTGGTATVVATVTDFLQATTQKTFTLQVLNSLAITSGQPTEGIVGIPYSFGFGAAGGLPPYIWSIAAGSLPPGVTLAASTAMVSGTPTEAGSFGFSLNVRDAAGRNLARTFIINITASLNVKTTELTGAFGAALSGTLEATGGLSPYTWEITSGALPSGLTLSASGAISGTPQTAGTTPVTVRVTDSRRAQATGAVNIRISLPALPPVTFTVANTNGSAVGPAQQPPINFAIGSAFPSEITGTMTLTFAPASGADDPNVRFSNGPRTLEFVIRQGSTQATYPSVQNPAVMTGTVAGLITITTRMQAGGVDVTPAAPPTVQLTINPAPPVISSVQLQQISGGVNVVVTGYSTAREVVSGVFRFAGASGTSIQQSELTVQLSQAFSAWYANSASNATGSQFTLSVPFNVSGSSSSIISVSVTLTNGRGNSNTANP